MEFKQKIKIHTGILLSCLMLLPVLPARAQLVRVRSQVSSDSFMIGDQIEYSLQVEADRGVEFLMPRIGDTLSHTLEILSRLYSDTSLSDNRVIVKNGYVITGFESGPQVVPSQEVIYQKDGEVDTARSMPLVINVYEPLVDTTQQIKPIKPPINTPVTFREVLPWVAGGLGILVVIGMVVRFLMRFLKRKKDPEGFALRPPEPAHIIAFRELDKLKEEKIWNRGKVKEYYSRLTEITRRYIERQYDIPAMESTTEEILVAFKTANLEDNLLDDILKDLLELADLVKFAKEDPLPVDNQTNLNNAYIFVQKTYPRFYRDEEEKKAANQPELATSDVIEEDGDV
jgi:hypothetical protein